MKVLVTGGMGFIGTNFLKYMLNKYPDYNFLCLDNLSVDDSKNNLDLFNEYDNYKFIKEDITNESNINQIDCINKLKTNTKIKELILDNITKIENFDFLNDYML